MPRAYRQKWIDLARHRYESAPTAQLESSSWDTPPNDLQMIGALLDEIDSLRRENWVQTPIAGRLKDGTWSK